MPRFAANLAFLFTERPLLERFGAARAAGFDAVELQFPYDHPAEAVKAELERHRLTMLGVNTPLGRSGEAGLGAVPGREADFATCFRQALDYVVAIGGRSVHCLAGLVPPEQHAAAEATFVSNLTRAAELADKAGKLVLIEPINPRDRPTYVLTRADQAADIIARIGAPNIRIQFDFYHMQIVRGDLIKQFEHYRPVIAHTQIAAVPSRQEPDEGEVNYPAIFAMLDEVGYDGWVGCEYRPRGRTEEGLGWARPYGVVPRG